MSASVIVGIVFLMVSLLLLFIGYLIAVKKQLWLIAGYDPNQVSDKDGLGKFVGTSLIIMGLFELAISILVLLLPDSVGPLAGSFMGVVIGSVLVMFINVRKYL